MRTDISTALVTMAVVQVGARVILEEAWNGLSETEPSTIQHALLGHFLEIGGKHYMYVFGAVGHTSLTRAASRWASVWCQCFIAEPKVE